MPEADIIRAFSQIVILIMSAVAHEVAHGFAAYQLGDPTAKDEGRLTLNPIKHLDLFGSIILPIVMYLSSFGQFFFAYAKPVPFNPYYFKNPAKDSSIVAIAGPATNIFIAVIIGLILRFAPLPDQDYFLRFYTFLSDIVFINIMLCIFNLIPIPPLDGSRVLRFLFPKSQLLDQIEPYGFMILIFLMISGVFSLISPIMVFIYKLLVGI